MTTLDYASSLDFRNAVSRAQWAVVQTGLITSGLALFGVYVLATRINDMHLMSMYVTQWIPIGPLLVGLIAGSGYIFASWWFGVRVGAKLVAWILVLQLAMFMACHYADFETLDLVYRETGQRVGFTRFFHYTTSRLGTDLDPWIEPPPLRGYLIRGAEAACFAIGGLLAALTLVGRPKCGLCGGLVRRRRLGKIAGPRVADTLKRLEERARLRDARGFYKEMTAGSDGSSADVHDDNAIELVMHRCDVCGVGAVEQVVDDSTPPPPPTTGASPRRAQWHVDVHDDFARELFEARQPKA